MARGSKRKRGGSWELRYELPRGEDGERNQGRETFKGTAKEADARLIQIVAGLNNTPAEKASEKASEMLVKECCELFLDESGEAILQPSSGEAILQPRSVEIYKSFFEKYLLPTCGDKKLVSVGRTDMQEVINAMKANGLAGTTINGNRARLSSLFSWAVRAEHLERSPVRGLTVPAASGVSSAQIVSGPEANKMLAALEGTEMWVPTFLALHTGMRPGEVLGLSWDDVNLDEACVFVRHTLHLRKGVLRLGPPKSRTSRRSVAVSTEVVRVLRELQEPANYWWSRRRGVGDEQVAFRQVCARADGKILTEGAWRDGFHAVLRREGLKDIRLHDLRHTHASLLLLDNVPMIVVSKRLGHANIQTTIDRYGHLLPTSDPEAAARIAEILNLGAKPNSLSQKLECTLSGDAVRGVGRVPLRDMPREQAWLLPSSLDELLPLDHPARFVAEFVDALDREDWKELGVEIEGDPLGAPAYHPRALLSVWLYGFMTGIRSSRKLEAACRDQIPYLSLTGWQHPDHNTLWRFYKDHHQAMRSLIKRTVRTAVAMELVDLAVQAVDGTKVAANASSGRSYDAEGLATLLERLDRAIAELEDQNEGETDRAPVQLPVELGDKRTLARPGAPGDGGPEGPQEYQPDGPGRAVHENEAGLLAGLQRPGHGFTSKAGRGNVWHAGHGR